MKHELFASVCAISVLGALAMSAPAAAQDIAQARQAGNVSGVVSGPDGAVLGGAIVRIPALNRQATTDSQGRFRITGLPTGEHVAEVTRFGVPTFSTTIAVTAGENPELALVPPAQEDAIVIEGIRANLNEARARERASDQFKSIIAADAVGQFGDQNVAEALQRVPAVTISRSEGEGNFVSVRGLAPGFNQVTLNGVEVGTDGDTRGTNLQHLGTNLLESIEVTKTLTPDMAANSIGGQINILSASAFRTGKNTLTLQAEGSYQDDADKVSPKFSASGTYLTGIFGGTDNFGIALSGNYFKRYINGNEYRNDDGLKFFTDREGDTHLLPGEIDNRREIGQRERINVNLGLEFRVTDRDEFAFHATWARVHDEDLKLREEWELDLANNVNEIVDVERGSFVLADQDKAADLWFQDIYNKSYTLDFSGKHTRGPWLIEYQAATSESRSDRQGSARAQWEEQDAMVRGTFERRSAHVEGIPFDEAQTFPGVPTNARRGDITNLANHAWVRAWFDDSLGGDNVKSARLDITRDIVLGSVSGFLKVGGLIMDRGVDADENRPQFNPSNAAIRNRICGSDADCQAFLTSNITDFGSLAVPKGSIMEMPVPSWASVRPLVEQARPLVDLALAGDELTDNAHRDYTADEKITAAYVMGNFDLSEKLSVIGGVRMERTEYEATGFLAITNDDYILPGTDPALRADIIEPMPLATNSYTDFFPSLTVNFRPTKDIVIRGSMTRSTKRPNFSEAQNTASLDTDLIFIDPVTGNEVDQDQITSGEYDFEDLTLDFAGRFTIGNPDLNPLMSTNYDLSISWYPSRSTYISAAVYKKNITNFIASVRLTDVTFAELPVALPQIDFFNLDPNQQFESVGVSLNGEKASVKGIEVAFSHIFDNGFFIDANAAFMDSDATISVLRDDPLPLIGQANRTANLSIGFENELVTLRLAGNHRGKYLVRIAGSDEERRNDVYGAPYTALDFNARLNVTDSLQLYFDAINLTNEREIREWQGDETSGPAYYIIEDYGRTFQVGARYRF